MRRWYVKLCVNSNLTGEPSRNLHNFRHTTPLRGLQATLEFTHLYNSEVELTVVFSKISRDATEATYLVTNVDWSAWDVVRLYTRRWTVATGHK